MSAGSYPQSQDYDNRAAYDEAVSRWGRELTDGDIRGIAGRIAGAIIADARNLHGPVVWITGNSYMPPLRAITEAEQVYQAVEDGGETFEFLYEEIERHLDRANVYLTQPEYDNALYAVDLSRWQYNENAAGDDLNDEWEPIETRVTA